MATDTWSSGRLHGSDADFRTWGLELSTKLQAMSGLVKTTDTGQIDWATVARPGVNTNAGYEIYYLNDTLHATAPIYFKLWFGTGSSAGNNRMQFEVGTGSNGSGTLTGLGLGAAQSISVINSAGTATASASYLCVAEGFFGLHWKGAIAWLIIQRTCNASGVPDGKGAHFLFRPATNFSSASIRYESTPAAGAISNAGMVGFVPDGVTASTLQNGDKQIFLHWGMFPDMRPLFGTGAYVITEYTAASTFSVALVGSTARTYLALNTAIYANGNSASYSFAMLWE